MRTITSVFIFILFTAPFSSTAQFNFGKSKKDKLSKKKKEVKTKVEDNAIFGLLYENELSSNFGAQHLLSDHQLISRLQNKFIPESIFKKDTKIAKIGNTFFRLAKIGLLDYPLTYVTGVTQREFFGTRYRAEQLGATASSVNLGIPQPYGNAEALSSFEFADSLSLTETALTLLGGTESNAILTSIMSKNSALNNKMLYEEGLMLLFSNNDLALRLATGKDFASNNIQNYVDQMTATYGPDIVTIDKLKVLSYLDLGLDAMNINALISMVKYIFKGEEQSDLLWLKLGEKVNYLPSFKLLLAPYGPEMLYQQYLKFDKTLFQLDFRHAATSAAKSLGVDLNIFNMLLGKKKKFSIDGFLALWNQPELDFQLDNVFETFKGFGGGGSATVNYKILKRMFVQARLGYKSKGYYQGLSLNNDLIFNIGLAFK